MIHDVDCSPKASIFRLDRSSSYHLLSPYSLVWTLCIAMCGEAGWIFISRAQTKAMAAAMRLLHYIGMLLAINFVLKKYETENWTTYKLEYSSNFPFITLKLWLLELKLWKILTYILRSRFLRQSRHWKLNLSRIRVPKQTAAVIWPIRSFNIVYNRIDDTFERSDWPNDGRGLIELEQLVFAKGKVFNFYLAEGAVIAKCKSIFFKVRF